MAIPHPLFLAPETILAQQRLSDRYGIPTFGILGGISTVPSSGRLSNINVGVGQYTDYTPGGFTKNLQSILDSIVNVGGSIGNTTFSGQSSIPTGDSGGVNPPPSSAPGLGSQIQSAGKLVSGALGTTGILLGGLVLLVVLLKK